MILTFVFTSGSTDVDPSTSDIGPQSENLSLQQRAQPPCILVTGFSDFIFSPGTLIGCMFIFPVHDLCSDFMTFFLFSEVEMQKICYWYTSE